MSPKTWRVLAPTVLLYVVDSLRADHLGVYGYSRPTSPHLDALAAEGVVFERARAHSSWTRPTMASIMTGMHPGTHGAARNLTRLPRGLPVLAEYLSAGGYQTAAFVTNGFVARKYGFGQGFEEFVRLKPVGESFSATSEEVNREVFRWLDEERDDRPFFLWLHSFDPHAPYTPPEPYATRFASSVPPDSPLRDMSYVRGLERRGVTDRDSDVRRGLSDLYDGEIAFNDAQFGALLERLRALGLYDRTLIVFVSDHGEEFADHGRWQHARSLFGELLRVPWVMKLPVYESGIAESGIASGIASAGLRVPQMVRQVDLLPTVLDFAGLKIPAGLEGRSLRPLLASGAASGIGNGGDDPAHRATAALASLDTLDLVVNSIEVGRYKLILYEAYDRPHRRVELYDVWQNPQEQNDVARSEPVWAGFLRAELLRRLAATSTAAGEQIDIDDEERKALEALGYLR